MAVTVPCFRHLTFTAWAIYIIAFILILTAASTSHWLVWESTGQHQGVFPCCPTFQCQQSSSATGVLLIAAAIAFGVDIPNRTRTLIYNNCALSAEVELAESYSLFVVGSCLFVIVGLILFLATPRVRQPLMFGDVEAADTCVEMQTVATDIPGPNVQTRTLVSGSEETRHDSSNGDNGTRSDRRFEQHSQNGHLVQVVGQTGQESDAWSIPRVVPSAPEYTFLAQNESVLEHSEPNRLDNQVVEQFRADTPESEYATLDQIELECAQLSQLESIHTRVSSSEHGPTSTLSSNTISSALQLEYEPSVHAEGALNISTIECEYETLDQAESGRVIPEHPELEYEISEQIQGEELSETIELDYENLDELNFRHERSKSCDLENKPSEQEQVRQEMSDPTELDYEDLETINSRLESVYNNT
ncbi:uncharacterized protein LOC129926247 isoform X2 [Biomphalaria glabrata]|uniref:Uncharacterized protein LOC129926247 isoform X2 n=1 Tax=Biomphalaria glabrata TaxID=6526 RepID=A0A9W3ACH1_BIOGL|nr:uncharacterized protein LOC129926247 isoform X2 [Biomphalaria glabrata]